ncbi:MAG: oligosaccharide flippase family protein [Candidatus Omnitrophota bacterium]|nr:oligosaccharide flippase family protein [Candidatus Omnitrophota bacterium]
MKTSSGGRARIAKDAGLYLAGSYGAQFFDIINGILIRRFLGPENMGIWAFLQVILNYAKHSALGVTAATSRDVPYYRRKGENDKAERVKNMVFSFTVVTATLAGLGVIVYALMNRDKYDTPFFFGLVVIGILIVLQRLFNLHIVLLRALKEFAFASTANVCSSVLTVLFTVSLVWRFGLYGLFAGLILNYILMIAGISIKSGIRFRFIFRFGELSPIFSLGFAMLVYGVLTTILMSVDRIMITKYMGFEALGIYSIALMAGNYLFSLPTMLAVAFSPYLQEAYAERDVAKDLEKFLVVPTLVIGYLFPCLIALVWVVSDWLIPLLLPAYVAGIPALKCLILSSFFRGLLHPFLSFFVTVRKHWHLCPIQGFLALLCFGLTWAFMKSGMGLLGVALASVITYGLGFGLISAYCYRRIQSLKKALGIYIRIFGVFVYFSGALYLMDSYAQTFPPTILRFSLQFAVFMVLMLPWIFLAERETKALTTLRAVVKSWLEKRANRGNPSVPNEESQ